MVLFAAYFSFRYRVRVIGGEQLKGLEGATLVMPNHTAWSIRR